MKKLSILCLGLLGGVAQAADPLQMEMRPVFDGSQLSASTPIIVDLANDGASAKGVVRVSNNSFTTDYPVELPTGARKRIYTYGTADYSGLTFHLITDRGRIFKPYQMPPVAYGDQSQQIALISDHPGEMGFLKRSSGSNQPRPLGDVYTDPGRAPDRAVGYSGIAAVVLGDGSERLTDAQIHALQLYALMGGTLIFTGGASPATLRDGHWSYLLPATNLHTETVRGSDEISRLGGEPMTETLTLTVGTPRPGASVREGVSYERPYGLGSILLYTFDPFEAPLDRYGGMASVFANTAKPVSFMRVRSFLQSYTNPTNPERGVMASSYSASISGPSGRTIYSSPTFGGSISSVREDPFSMTLPPAERIFGVLALYFLLVVPLNFLVLRKAKRGEWAWFTAPVMSVAFAGIIFASAQSLYSASMSTATQGVLVMQEDMPWGAFLGTSQMFIPRGGSYDLKLKGVDSLGLIDNEQYDYYPGSRSSKANTMELQPVDVGEVTVPSMRASNLAFKEISYRQILPANGWFSVTDLGGGGYRVSNNSPYTLRNASFAKGYRMVEIGDLLAGQTRSARIQTDAHSATPNPSSYGVMGSNDARNFTGPTENVALSGKFTDFRPGPQIGKEVAERTRIDVVFFASGRSAQPATAGGQ